MEITVAEELAAVVMVGEAVTVGEAEMAEAEIRLLSLRRMFRRLKLLVAEMVVAEMAVAVAMEEAQVQSRADSHALSTATVRADSVTRLASHFVRQLNLDSRLKAAN
jgi:hypothetical protein